MEPFGRDGCPERGRKRRLHFDIGETDACPPQMLFGAQPAGEIMRVRCRFSTAGLFHVFDDWRGRCFY